MGIYVFTPGGASSAGGVSVTGSYTNVPSAPTDLETAISELDSAISNAGDPSIPVFWVDPAGDADSAAIQAQVDAAIAAGGGIVQLGEGTYTIDAGIEVDDCNGVIIQGVGDSTILSVTSGTGFTTNANGVFYIHGDSTSKTSVNLNTMTANDTVLDTATAGNAANFLTGDTLLVEGTDAAGDRMQNFYEASSDGNGTNGNIAIRGRVLKTLTSGVLNGWSNGKNNGIRNLRMTHTSGSGTAINGIRCQYTTRTLIENVHCDDFDLLSSDRGIYADLNADITVRGCTFRDIGLTAIHLEGVCVGTIERNFIQNTNAGIYLVDGAFGCTEISIDKNTLYNCTSPAIQSLDAETSFVSITSNNIERSASSNGGIYLADGRSYAVAHNKISHVQGGDGIRLTGYTSTIVNNTIKHCSGGIELGTGDNNTIQGNVIAYSSENGINLSSNSNQLTVVGNVILSPAGIGIRINAVNRSSICNNVIESAGGNGIDLQATADNNNVMGNTLLSITGTEILVAAGCDNNNLVYNNLPSGSVSDSGTGNSTTGNITS